MDGGAWWAAVHGIAKSRTRLSDFTFTFHFHALEKEMATHSSVLAWRVPGTGEPGGLPSMGSHRVGHDWSDSSSSRSSSSLKTRGERMYLTVILIHCHDITSATNTMVFFSTVNLCFGFSSSDSYFVLKFNLNEIKWWANKPYNCFLTYFLKFLLDCNIVHRIFKEWIEKKSVYFSENKQKIR